MVLIANLDEARVSAAVAHDTHRLSVASFLRPADVTAYGVGDAISDSTGTAKALVFPKCTDMDGGSGLIVGASLLLDVVEGTGVIDLYVYDVEPTGQLDNVALLVADSFLPNLRSVIRFTFTDAVSTGGGMIVKARNTTLYPFFETPFITELTSMNLYGLLAASTGFTPDSGTKFIANLEIRPDGIAA